MSNYLSIEVVEIRVRGSEVVDYGFIARDQYGTHFDIGYESFEAFRDRFPTNLDILRSLSQSAGFDGAIIINGDKVTLDAITCMEFHGVEDDGSFKVVE